jgi:hypothetical protein
VDLDALPPRWVTLTATDDGLPVVTLVDEAVALAAPFASHPWQIGVGVHLAEPDPLGQPGEGERAALRALEQELVDGLAPVARLVSSLTLRGVREYVFYARDTSTLEAFAARAPEASHEVQAFALEDPSWKGLREIAGLLEPGEEPLRPDELA